MTTQTKPNVSKLTELVETIKPFKPMGRPNKITRAIIGDIYDSVKMGMPKDQSAKLAGISEATFHIWMNKARELTITISEANEKENAIDIEMSENDYYLLEFLEAVLAAEAEFVYEATKSIREEGPSGYKWLLSRIFRKQYGEKITVDSDEGIQLQLELPGLIDHLAQKEPEQIGRPSDDDK